MDVTVCGSRSTVLATLGRPSRIPLASTQEALRTDVGLRFLPEPWMGTVLNILGNQMKPAGGLLWVNNCLLLVFCPQLPSCLYNYFSSLKFILSEIILVAYPEFSLIVCICVCVCDLSTDVIKTQFSRDRRLHLGSRPRGPEFCFYIWFLLYEWPQTTSVPFSS